MPEYGCGCVNDVHTKSGVLTCIVKCEFHQQWSKDHPQGDTPDYFKDIGYLDDRGIPQNKRLINELKEALKAMHAPPPYRESVLELGCGLGAYVPMFLQLGCEYQAIERSNFSAEWTRNNYNVTVYQENFEEVNSPQIFDVIFAAHLFEHLKDAPAGLEKAHRWLKGNGGRLFLVVPDDGDPTNPDHFWFFTPDTLRALLKKIGFKEIDMVIFKRVPQENFIYCVASKR